MSLLAPLFLAGLLGLALPWLLHRFSRHNPTKLPFPSSRFLEATTPPVSRTRQLKHRVLFALRCLLLIALCFLFTNPFFDAGADEDSTANVTLLLDVSLSMQTSDLWEQAQQRAQEAVDAQPAGAAVELMTFDSVLAERIALTTELSSVKSEINRIQPGSSAADYGVVMQQLDAVLSARSTSNQVVLITDAQIANLPSQLRQMVAPGIDQLTVIALNPTDAVNASLRAEAITEDGATARVAVTASLTTHEPPQSPIKANKILRVAHDDRVLREVPLFLNTEAHQTTVIDGLPLPAVEPVNLTLSLVESDDLPIDDTVKVTVREAQPVELSLLSLTSRIEPVTEVYLTTALETGGRAKVVPVAGDLASIGSSVPHLVVVADLRSFDIEGSGVADYVRSGGNALVVQDASVIQSGQVTEAVRIGLIEYGHPLGLGEFDWLSVRFYQMMADGFADKARVLLATTTNVPILSERSIEGDSSGRLLFLADPLDARASDLPLQPAFVELMQSVLDYFTSTSALPSRVTVGELVSLPANTQLLDPQGDALLDSSKTNTAQDIRPSDPGIYTILSKQHGDQILEVMTPASESDLRRMSEADITVWERNRPAVVDTDEQNAVKLANSSDTNSVESRLPDVDGSRYIELWRWLLPLVLVFVIAESLFANQRLSVRRDGS
ncbi:MAG: BatA and WFA domain-containing protein [Granulosicoccus sp.]|nr:BatA and WFA domain-containing protein [Granulosicoccus sp.]